MSLSRRVAVGLLALLAAVAFAGACGAGEETLEERWARLDVPEPEIVFLGDWTDGERAAITREVKSVQVAHAARFGVVTSEFTLYISTERELLVEPYRERSGRTVRQPGVPNWFTCGGFAWPPAIFIVLETCDEEEHAHGLSIAHQYFHVLQAHVGLLDAGQVFGSGGFWPNWLAEGAAVYASAHHAEEQGRWTVSWKRKAARLAWSSIGICFPGPCNKGPLFPGDFVFAHDYYLAHDAGFLAVDWLVERKGEEALMEFFRLGGGRHEFEQAFGMTLDEFGEGIEELWRDVAPPFTNPLRGSVLDPEGNPVAYAVVEPVVWVEDERVVLGGDRANSQGAFDFNGPEDGLTLAVRLKCSDDSARLWVFAGELGEGGFVADEDGEWREGDEGARPFGRVENRTGIVITLPETEKALKEKHCDR